MGATHAPAPLQVDAPTSESPAHVGAPQLFAAPGSTQASRVSPSQAASHTPPAPAHAVREPWGAPVTAVQAPTWPATLQASHWPPQATLQHTPSTQKAEPHSRLSAHAWPLGFRGTHAPLAHR